MDFQTLNRRELQALCKLNKIPANITNIAMADALKSLETVEGIEGFMNSSNSKTGGLSIESPKRIEVSSPRVLHTSPKTTTWKKVSEVMETSLVSCTSKKVPETSSCHVIAKNESLVNHENNSIPNTPQVAVTTSKVKGVKTSRKGSVKKEITATVESIYSTRRSTRLAAKKSESVTSKEDLCKGIKGKHDVVVLDESDDDLKNEKVVHVDTTKLDSEIGKVDNLKVKLDEIFGQIEDMDFEERQKGEEVVNADGIEKNVSVNKGDCFVNHKKQKACMNLESLIEVSPIRKKAKIDDVNQVLKTPPVSSTRKNDNMSEDIAKKQNNCISSTTPIVVAKSTLTHKETVKKGTTTTTITSLDRGYITKRSMDLGKGIEEKHDDDVVLDDSSKIEKVVHVDTTTTTTLESEVKKVDNLKVKLVEIFEDVDLEKRQNNSEEKSGQVDCNPSEPLKVDDHNMVLDGSDQKSNKVDTTTTTTESEVEKIDCCGEVDNSKVTSVENFENVDSEERQNKYVDKNESLIQEIAVDVRPVMHGEVDLNSQQVNLHGTITDVSFVNEENQVSISASDVIHNPTLINSKVLDNKENSKKEPEVVVVEEKETNNEKEAVKDEKPKSVITSPSLRQLKKKLKQTLLNSPTPQAVVVEENKKEDEKVAKSLENTCSLRQLRKQLKAISGKCNMDANKDDKVNVL